MALGCANHTGPTHFHFPTLEKDGNRGERESDACLLSNPRILVCQYNLVPHLYSGFITQSRNLP